jgi:hypothetical protein
MVHEEKGDSRLLKDKNDFIIASRAVADVAGAVKRKIKEYSLSASGSLQNSTSIPRSFDTIKEVLIGAAAWEADSINNEKFKRLFGASGGTRRRVRRGKQSRRV